jgi:hypothetical protein
LIAAIHGLVHGSLTHDLARLQRYSSTLLLHALRVLVLLQMLLLHELLLVALLHQILMVLMLVN